MFPNCHLHTSVFCIVSFFNTLFWQNYCLHVYNFFDFLGSTANVLVKNFNCVPNFSSTFNVRWRSFLRALLCNPGHILESKGMLATFRKKAKKIRKKKKGRRVKKSKMFENLGKNVQNLKIFWKYRYVSSYVCHALYIRNYTLHDQNFLYTCVKWSYLQKFFSFSKNFDFLGS